MWVLLTLRSVSDARITRSGFLEYKSTAFCVTYGFPSHCEWNSWVDSNLRNKFSSSHLLSGELFFKRITFISMESDISSIALISKSTKLSVRVRISMQKQRSFLFSRGIFCLSPLYSYYYYYLFNIFDRKRCPGGCSTWKLVRPYSANAIRTSCVHQA